MVGVLVQELVDIAAAGGTTYLYLKEDVCERDKWDSMQTLFDHAWGIVHRPGPHQPLERLHNVLDKLFNMANYINNSDDDEAYSFEESESDVPGF